MEQVGRLGLSEYARKIKRSEVKDHESTLSSGAGHAYFVSKGERDDYGKAGPVGGALFEIPRRRRSPRLRPYSSIRL